VHEESSADRWSIGDLRRDRSFDDRLRALTGRTPAPIAGYTLFLPGRRGYEVVDRDGTAPLIGARVVVGDATFLVDGTRRSPFPGDPRPCFVLTRVE
jgi:hypothetical protein